MGKIKMENYEFDNFVKSFEKYKRQVNKANRTMEKLYKLYDEEKIGESRIYKLEKRYYRRLSNLRKIHFGNYFELEDEVDEPFMTRAMTIELIKNMLSFACSMFPSISSVSNADTITVRKPIQWEDD